MKTTTRYIKYDEFVTIYGDYMIEDFPPEERRPLHSIKLLYNEGRYSCFILEEEGVLLAYATFITDLDEDVALLDYYAVTKVRRGQGIGTLFLQHIRESLPVSGLLIESELPTSNDDDKERLIREKRIRFYEQNDSVVTKYVWHAYGVDYSLLYLPINKKIEKVDVGVKIKELYAFTLPPELMNKYTKLYIK